MSDVLIQIMAVTGLLRPYDQAFIHQRYLDHPDQLALYVATSADDDRPLGFQSLKYAVPDNEYGVPEGWGIIGTHISPQAHRRGIGGQLFQRTQTQAYRHGLHTIEATINAGNPAGLAYYQAMGFRTYQENERVVHKRLDLPDTAEASRIMWFQSSIR